MGKSHASRGVENHNLGFEEGQLAIRDAQGWQGAPHQPRCVSQGRSCRGIPPCRLMAAEALAVWGCIEGKRRDQVREACSGISACSG